MAIKINMPALSPTMESGTLANWQVKEGDEVTSGDILCEIETDKATMEVESIDDGIVGKLVVAGGTEDVPVGALIAVLLEEGEDASAIDISAINQDAETKPTPTSTPVAAPVEEAKIEVAPTPVATVATPASAGRVKASPLAKRIAKDKRLDLSTIAGTGPNGRIIKADVEGTVEGTVAVAQPVTPVPVQTLTPVEPLGDAVYEEVKLSNMRKTIAKRLTEAKQTVPHFYLTVDVELDKLLSLRKEINSQLEDGKISVNDFIIRACGLALAKVPDANVQFGGNVMRRYARADISVAVATDGGLITPIIKAADQKGLKEISSEMKALAGKAKDGKLMPEEYQGGTFSISNLGMMGVKEFSAVINPPQGAILAVGAGAPQAVVKDGAIQSATVMSMTLSCDHRAIDGAVGAELLGVIKGYLEEPLSMLL